MKTYNLFLIALFLALPARAAELLLAQNATANLPFSTSPKAPSASIISGPAAPTISSPPMANLLRK